MKNGFMKICSIFLVIILFANMLPLQVFAQQLNTDKKEPTATAPEQAETENTSGTVADESRIVEELIQKRTEYSKEFLMDNGLHMVAVYPEPVHYAAADGWEEIDNTLLSKSNGIITNTAGVWDVSFPQQLSKEKGITVKKDGYTLSFFMAGELTDNNTVVRRSALVEQPTTEIFAVASMQQSAAAIQKLDLTTMQASVKYKEMVPEKAHSKLSYVNVYQNTDVTYDLVSNKVKESVILKSYNRALRGYRYTLDVGTMVPVLEEDGQIIFYDANRENIVMVMPAPYMVDDAGEDNHEIQVQLTGNGSSYTMTYLLPRQWLAAEDRAWPVILDPVVQPALTTSNISDRTVSENYTFSSTEEFNYCGYVEGIGITRFFLKYNSLPSLTASDVIIGAFAQMYCGGGSNMIMPVHVHRVNGTWAADTISWNNKPAYNTNVQDYAYVIGEGGYSWDVTDIVRGWYAGENTGMMFKASNEVEDDEIEHYYGFYSADNSIGLEVIPTLTVVFRNNNGLESYWDYTTASAGRAGTGYVNNYTGNLVWTRNVLGFGGNRMPVSISHVYNANDAQAVYDPNNSNDSAGNGFGLGKGWRTNYHQLVYQWNGNDLCQYYVWEDSDGTDHYFNFDVDVGAYKNEDGLELILTDNGSGTQKYCITDKVGNKSYFDTTGRLRKIENNQETNSSINISYLGTSYQIDYITDGVNRKYQFEYTSGLLSKIKYTGTGTTEISSVQFTYDSNENLVAITDNDNAYSTYSYSANSLLHSAIDVDGYTLHYTYNTIETGKPARVATIEETQGNVAGRLLTFEYQHNQTSVSDHNGNIEVMQFNNMGNTIGIHDNEGHAQYAQFSKNNAEDTGKSNQLTLSSKLQNTVGNMLKDSSFENGTTWNPNTSSVTVENTTQTAYRGSRSLKVTSSVTNPYYGVYSPYTVMAPGEVFTFSAYVKSTDAACQLVLHFYDPTTDIYQNITSATIEPTGSWIREEVSYKNETGTNLLVHAYLFVLDPGTVYMDCVQKEKANTASRYNLVENGDFRYGGFGWSSDAGIYVSEPFAPQLENTIYYLAGTPLQQNRLSQTINISGCAGDSFVFAGWAMGNAAPTSQSGQVYALQLRFNYTDEYDTWTQREFTVNFNPDSNSWQYVAAAAVAGADYSSVTIQVIYDFNINEMICDGIQLFKEEFGTSYVYDGNGNVTSVVDLQKRNTEYVYDDNNNLTATKQNGEIKTSYTYDDYHNMTSATTEEGLTTHYTYDTYGNLLTTYKVSSDEEYPVVLESSSTYTTDGNRLVSTTDTAENTTKYGYNEQTNVLEWVEYPEDTEATRTNYSYDEIYRTVSVSATTDTGKEHEVYYDIYNDMLFGICTPTVQLVTLHSAPFGQVSGVFAGNYMLASNSYTNDRNHYLSTIDYGDPVDEYYLLDSVSFSYDNKGRVIRDTYGDGETVDYAYNSMGDLARVEDSESGITTTYYYDLIDRLVKYREVASGYDHSVEYNYDEENRLATQVETINGTEYSYFYDYAEGNRLMAAGDQTANKVYTYDDFGQVTFTETNADGFCMVEEYDYEMFTGTTTTGRVQFEHIRAGEYGKSFEYVYDGNGNIIIKAGSDGVIFYTYDSLNQLIRESSYELGYSYAWTYDDAGNILSRKEYNEYGELVKTVNYSYEDSSWGDLLTGYDGRTITSMGGNILSDGIWTYTWAHGKELAAMSNGTTTWSYEYDANGMRTRRTNGSTTYQYVYNGSSLSQMTVGSNTLHFTYDASGKPMAVTYNGTTYYYATNMMGDVLAILDGNSTAVVSYCYNAWGNEISCTGTMAATLGVLNPLRYRSYVYDHETGLYYLQSRYYNPEWGRFISADVFLSTGQGLLGSNLFAYCGNNPVNGRDPFGRWTIGFSLGLNLTMFLGISVGIGVYWDDKGNIDWQWAYAVPGVNNTSSVGLFDIGASLSVQITNANTVYNLYGPTTYIGGSGGPLWYVGADVISFEDASDGGGSFDGFQIVGGVGVGVDLHVTETYTKQVGEKTNTADYRPTIAQPKWHSYYYPDFR